MPSCSQMERKLEEMEENITDIRQRSTEGSKNIELVDG